MFCVTDVTDVGSTISSALSSTGSSSGSLAQALTVNLSLGGLKVCLKKEDASTVRYVYIYVYGTYSTLIYVYVSAIIAYLGFCGLGLVYFSLFLSIFVRFWFQF